MFVLVAVRYHPAAGLALTVSLARQQSCGISYVYFSFIRGQSPISMHRLTVDDVLLEAAIHSNRV
jgi:hypothetical protein